MLVGGADFAATPYIPTSQRIAISWSVREAICKKVSQLGQECHQAGGRAAKSVPARKALPCSPLLRRRHPGGTSLRLSLH